MTLQAVDTMPSDCDSITVERRMSKQRTEVPYGTLDLLILITLETMGTMHGYGLARRIEQVSDCHCDDKMTVTA